MRRSDHPDLPATLELLLRAYALKDEPRAGWLLRGISDPESVADHSWGTALLCLLFAAEEGVDRGQALAIALVHDLAEAETGDVPARAEPAGNPGEKARREREAMERLLAGGDGAGVRRLWEAYEERSSREALFVRDMNLVDMCLQALKYEREGRHEPADGGASDGALDEFFATSRPRLSTATGRRLFAGALALYEAAKRERGAFAGKAGPD